MSITVPELLARLCDRRSDYRSLDFAAPKQYAESEVVPAKSEPKIYRYRVSALVEDSIKSGRLKPGES